MEVKVSSQIKAPAHAIQTHTVSADTIPAHLIERMESEWRQMRDPRAQSSSWSHSTK